MPARNPGKHTSGSSHSRTTRNIRKLRGSPRSNKGATVDSNPRSPAAVCPGMESGARGNEEIASVTDQRDGAPAAGSRGHDVRLEAACARFPPAAASPTRLAAWGCLPACLLRLPRPSLCRSRRYIHRAPRFSERKRN